MMKKLLIVMLLLSTYLVASMNLQTASKEQLMSIAGIGAKKAMAIMEYRKKHKIHSASDLLKVKGIGKKIVSNVKGGVKSKAKSSFANAKNKYSSKKGSSSLDKAKAKKAKYSKKADKKLHNSKKKAHDAQSKFKKKKDSAKDKMNKMKSMF